MNATQNLIDALGSLGSGDHLCLIYRNRQEQFATLIPFIKQGLDKGEKCLYIVDERTAREVEEALQQESVDVQGCLDAGQLSILTKEDAYVKEGYFDSDKMIALLAESTEAALQEGYPGLRATGEMTWIFARLPGSERLVEHEARLNRFFPGSKALAICQYNEARFSPELLLDVLATHPLVIVGGRVCRNFYYVPPDEFLREKRDMKLEYARYLRHIQEREQLELALREYAQELERKVKEKIAEVQAHYRELAILFGINRTMAQSLDLKEILSNALEEVLAVLEVEAGGIVLVEPDGEMMTLRVHRGLSDEFLAAVRRIRLGEGISGQAVAQKKPVVLDVPDYPTERLAPFIVREGFQTLVSTPLLSKGQALGALTLGTRRSRAFPPQELELLVAIGQQLGAAFANARLHEETKRWTDRLALINEVGQVAAVILDPKAVFQTVVEVIVNRFGFHGVNAFLADHANREVVFQAAAGPHAGLIPRDYRQPFDTGIIGWVAWHGETLLANDVTQEPRFIEAFPESAGSYLSELAVPIKIEERVVGVLDIESRQVNAFNDMDVVAVEALADRLAITIGNAELYEQLAEANRQLEEKVEKLEIFYRVAMGREKRILELKEQIRELQKREAET